MTYIKSALIVSGLLVIAAAQPSLARGVMTTEDEYRTEAAKVQAQRQINILRAIGKNQEADIIEEELSYVEALCVRGESKDSCINMLMDLAETQNQVRSYLRY